MEVVSFALRLLPITAIVWIRCCCQVRSCRQILQGKSATTVSEPMFHAVASGLVMANVDLSPLLIIPAIPEIPNRLPSFLGKGRSASLLYRFYSNRLQHSIMLHQMKRMHFHRLWHIVFRRKK